MAFNAEQIFLDALGREPTAEEFQEIRLTLWMLTRAGFAVDDPSNAPLVTPWAWMWARLPRPTETRTALAAVSQEIAERSKQGIETIEAITRELRANIDPETLAAAIIERMPPLTVQHRFDGSALTSALRESFALLWIGLAAFAIGLAGALGWHLGVEFERATLAPEIAHAPEPAHPRPRVTDRPARTRPRP